MEYYTIREWVGFIISPSIRRSVRHFIHKHLNRYEIDQEFKSREEAFQHIIDCAPFNDIGENNMIIDIRNGEIKLNLDWEEEPEVQMINTEEDDLLLLL